MKKFAMNKYAWFGAVALVLLASGLLWVGFFQSPEDRQSPELNGELTTYQSGPFEIGIRLSPITPQVGQNQLTLLVRDGQGDPVTDANIQAFGEMPSMGAMPAMRAGVEFEEIASGKYVGPFELPMRGSWPLTIDLEKTGLGQTQLKFDMATGRTGLRLVSGAAEDRRSRPAKAGITPITVSSRRRQLIGVEIEEAMYRSLTRTIRAVGVVTVDDTQRVDITLRYDAWVGELMADFVGKEVEKGEVLFTVYGPEILSAQQEYLQVLSRGASSTVAEAARKRLLLLGLTPAQIEDLERRGEPMDYVPVLSPISGTVMAKSVVEGSARDAGMSLMRIADLSEVWIEGEIYESDLALVEVGMPAKVSLPYLPGLTFDGKIEDIYPFLDSGTRTGRVRLSLPNPSNMLKPNMYAEVNLKADLGERLVVPEEAVIFVGNNRIVFVDIGAGRLKPVNIDTGVRAEGFIEVLNGLQPGDEVVTSGNFLIAAETRLKTGVEDW